jgi:hypothetical protein
MSWLHYLIEANIYLGIFYLCYCVLLSSDTHYTLGRTFLLFSCITAFILPLTQLSVLKPAVLRSQLIQVELAAPVQKNIFDTVLIYIYITGAAIAFFVLLFRLLKIFTLMRNSHFIYLGKYKVINLDTENTAFSFFNYLFIGSNLPQADTVMIHELVHIRQRHSVDIIFLEILKVINWFNPFIYLIQRSLKTVHEYIADEQTAARELDALAYSAFLLNNAYGIQGTSIAHSFFNYNLLKKRIIMLNKNRSGKLARLKYLAALPLCAGMLCASTLVFSKDYGLIDLAPQKAVKQAIDSTKYTLKLTDVKNNISGVSDEIVFNKNGVTTTYKLSTLTKKQIADLKEKGYDLSVVERKNEFPDTIKRKLPPPPPPAPPKSNVHKRGVPPPPPPAAPVDKRRLPPPPPEPPKNKVTKIRFPIPAVRPDKPSDAPKVDRIKFPPPVVKPDRASKVVRVETISYATPAKAVKDSVNSPRGN